MKYSLHPETELDLREAATYYKERAGSALSQALFAEFEHSMQLLMQHPLLGELWLFGKTPFHNETLSICRYLYSRC